MLYLPEIVVAVHTAPGKNLNPSALRPEQVAQSPVIPPPPKSEPTVGDFGGPISRVPPWNEFGATSTN